MSMHEWPDDDLDDLFRKSAEESDPATNPQDWQHLKARLGGHDRTHWTTRLFRWILPAVLLLGVSAGGIIWYTGTYPADNNRIVHKPTRTCNPNLVSADRDAKSLPNTKAPLTTTLPHRDAQMPGTGTKAGHAATRLKPDSRPTAFSELAAPKLTSTRKPTNRLAGDTRQIALTPSYQQDSPIPTERSTQMPIENRTQVRVSKRKNVMSTVGQVDSRPGVSQPNPTR